MADAPTQVVMQKPLNVLHRRLQESQRVVVWMQHDNHTRLEGTLVGYDGFTNLVLEDAVEINTKLNKQFELGRTLLKGDNVGLIHAATTA